MPEISAAHPDEIACVVELLDAEFMVKRGRTGSVAAHYPDIFRAANAHNFLVLRVDDIPVSICVVLPITVHREQAIYNGGLIGFVYTEPAHRGQGLAAQLLSEAAHVIESRNLDFGALFTTLDGFYERLGWVPEDRGLFGTIANEAEIEPLELSAIDPSTAEGLEWIDSIRQRSETLWVERSAASYRRFPLGVERIFAVFSPYRDAYALVGTQGQSAFIYELSGTESGREIIWNALLQSHRQISVNTHADAGAIERLRQNPELQLQPQNLTLWKWFVGGASTPRKALNHLPYFDRM